MPNDWRPVVRSLMYGIERDGDLPGRAERMFETIAMAPEAAVAAPDAVVRALDDALASEADLAAVYPFPQPHSDRDLRAMFASLVDKLRAGLAKAGEPAPSQGDWRPTEDYDHPGVALNAGDAVPTEPQGWWRLLRNA